MTVLNRKYGWRPDLPDHRDRIFQASAAPSALPSSIDLRALCPPVYDQGQIGSCTANAIAAAIQFDQSKQNLPSFAPSRLFLYYNERALEGTTASDSGATLRDGMRTVNKVGVCPETLWLYSTANVLTRPKSDALRTPGNRPPEAFWEGTQCRQRAYDDATASLLGA